MNLQQRISAAIDAFRSPSTTLETSGAARQLQTAPQPTLQSGGGLELAARAEHMSAATTRVLNGPTVRVPRRDDVTGRMDHGRQKMQLVLANPALSNLVQLADAQVRVQRSAERDYGPPVGIILGTNMIVPDAKVYGSAPVLLYRDDAGAVRFGYVDPWDREFIQPIEWHHAGDIDFAVVASTLEKLMTVGADHGRLPNALIGYGYELSSPLKIASALAALARYA